MAAALEKKLLVICSTNKPKNGSYRAEDTADYLQGNTQSIIFSIYGPNEVERFINGVNDNDYFPYSLPFDQEKHFDGIVFLGCNCLHQLFEDVNVPGTNIYDEQTFKNIHKILKDDGIICFIERKRTLRRTRISMKTNRKGINLREGENEHKYNDPDDKSYTTVPLTRLKFKKEFNSLIPTLTGRWGLYFYETDFNGHIVYRKNQLIEGGNNRRKRKIRKTIRKSRN